MKLAVDWRVERFFGEGFEVVRVARRGWEGKEDGDLLAAAQREFDVFLTMDQGIPHQQNLEDIRLVILLLEAPSNRLTDLAPLVPEAMEVLTRAQPGDVLRVPAS